MQACYQAHIFREFLITGCGPLRGRIPHVVPAGIPIEAESSAKGFTLYVHWSGLAQTYYPLHQLFFA